MPQSDESRLAIDLGVLMTEPADEYHAKAGKFLSSHQLIDFINCPWLYRKKQLGLLPDEDTPALLVGQATHCRILEGREAYRARFALGGPINKNTSKPFGRDTKAFREWATTKGKPGVHHNDLPLIENMASGVAMNDEAVDLLLYGRSEGVVRAEYCGTPCQIRVDWLHPHRGVVDLKTTADLTWFENEARRRRYHHQASFYQSVLAEVIGQRVPVSVYTLLNHDGDYEQAAGSLRQLGYGSDPLESTGVDISAILGQACGPVSEDSDDGPPIRRLKDLVEDFTGLNPPVIHGLLREGETMNVIASPKMGKSWFVSMLAISIASGMDWLGLTVEQGRVLHIDNELHLPTITHRYKTLSEALKLPHRLYSGNIDTVSLRGELRDLYSLGSWFRRIDPGEYKLVIIDAFYRTLPRDTDENDNGAIASLYNHIDRYAGQMECAFVLVHHSSKGNQSGKAVTDVGAGAGSQSRAADTHLILRQHQEEGMIVLESAIRSWPPMEPRALLWQWPLFLPAHEVDTSALLGAEKPKSKAKEIPLDDFVEGCVAINDPCSKRSVRYEAEQRFGLSERRAYEMLDLAIERGLVARIQMGSHMRYVKSRLGLSGDKALWTAALLARNPDADAQVIASEVGVSERYVRQIRNQNKGLTAELEEGAAELSSGTERN
ncbi:MAG: AAA family ATPase [Phycisphaerae bacterium]|nr:AAA family ATPase [Phycisphaerae bacterium]